MIGRRSELFFALENTVTLGPATIAFIRSLTMHHTRPNSHQYTLVEQHKAYLPGAVNGSTSIKSDIFAAQQPIRDLRL